MNSLLNIIILEDNPSDAELMQRELRKAGLEFVARIAHDKAAFLEALAAFIPDLLLADYSLPGFDGLTAIEALKAGATDYVLKHRLDRLGPVTGRALREAQQLRERKQTQEELAKQRELLKVTLTSIGDAVITTDTDGRITFLNPVAESLTGWHQEETLGLPVANIFRIINEKTRKPSEDVVARVMKDRRATMLANHTALVVRDGREVPVEDSAAPIIDADGNLLGVVLVFHDVTQKRRDREALQKAKDELELRVRERTAELSQIVEALQNEVARRALAEETLRERSGILRKLASELTLAEQSERRRLAETLHDDLQQLLFGAKLRLVSLDRSAGQPVKQATAEVEELIDQSIECSRALTAELSPPILYQGGLVPALEWLAIWMQQKYGLTVELQTDEAAVPESEDMKVLLFRSVRELLFNVVKHAKIKTAQICLRKLDEHLELTVCDKGVGFAAQTVVCHAGKPHGFGLFSIRERMDLLGGKMEFHSVPWQGSRFTLTAPLKITEPAADETPATLAGVKISRTGAAPAAAASAPAPGGRRIRVLLVDDHIVVRQGLSHLLREEPDIEIVGEASDGLTAIDMIRRLLPDVVTMDISMPGMTGIEATRIVHAEFPDICVIGLSMFDEAELAAEMREAGAVNYLTKSGPADALVAAIRARE